MHEKRGIKMSCSYFETFFSRVGGVPIKLSADRLHGALYGGRRLVFGYCCRSVKHIRPREDELVHNRYLRVAVKSIHNLMHDSGIR